MQLFVGGRGALLRFGAGHDAPVGAVTQSIRTAIVELPRIPD